MSLGGKISPTVKGGGWNTFGTLWNKKEHMSQPTGRTGRNLRWCIRESNPWKDLETSTRFSSASNHNTDLLMIHHSGLQDLSIIPSIMVSQGIIEHPVCTVCSFQFSVFTSAVTYFLRQRSDLSKFLLNAKFGHLCQPEEGGGQR